jgi:hypothetical protein
MWLALVLLVIIALCAFALVTGTIWMAVPVVLLAIIAFLVYTAGVREASDGRIGDIEPGAGGTAGTPEDTTSSGAAHERTGYAHEGQRHMTP